MTTDRFAYEASRWSAGQPDQAKRWFDELELTGPQNVRARLAQTDAGSAGSIAIGAMQMTIGFTQEWLAWHDRQQEAAEAKRHKKHWLDWAGWVVAVVSLGITAFATYRTVLFQRDDIRLVMGNALTVTRDKKDLLLAQDQEFTFINSGNRQAVISEIYGELVLVTDPNAKCDGRFAKSIILNPTQIVLKPGDILPLRAKVVQQYPWEKDKDGLRFRQTTEEQGSHYLVCLHLYVTTPESSSVKSVQPLYSVSPGDGPPSELFRKDEPLNVIQRTRLGFG